MCGLVWFGESRSCVLVFFETLSYCLPRLFCVLNLSLTRLCFYFYFLILTFFFLPQKTKSKNRDWRDGSAV